MPVVETLKLQITADNKAGIAALEEFAGSANNLEKSIAIVTNQLSRLKKIAEQDLGTKQFERLGKMVVKTENELSRLKNLQPIGPGAIKGFNQATNALTNLGRVAQDAPFGFIGIQNNLNPLLESFQRLKQETGSSGAALKALGKSLMGPGGVGLALSVASALILAFGDDLAAMANSAGQATASQKEFSDSMSKAAGDAASETAQLTALVNVINDTTQSTETRERALKQLKDTYKGNIELQKVDLNDSIALKTAIDNISQAILRKAKAQAFANLIAEEEAKKAKLANESDAERAKRLTGLKGLINDYARPLAKLVGGTNSAIIETKLMGDAADKASADFDVISKNIQTYTELLNKNTLAQIKSNDASKLNTGDKKGVDEEALKWENWNRELERYLSNESKISGHQRKQETIVPGLSPVSGPQKADLTNNAFNQIQSQVSDRLARNAAEQKAWNDQIQQTLQLTNALAQPFDDLANALLQGQNLGEALGNVFSKLAADIAAAAVKALIFKTILSAIGVGSGGGIIPGFGELFGSFLGLGKLKLAAGGITQGPTRALIGEAGPEAVIPLDRLGAFIDHAAKIGANAGGMGGMQPIVLDTRIAGNDIFLSQRRTDFWRGLRAGV